MIPLEQVREQILQRLSPLPAEDVALPESVGRFLAETIVSRDAMPPFDNSAMDGFALRAADTASATPESPVRLSVTDVIEAGREVLPNVDAGRAMRIYTGAAIPPGADSVAPFESTLGFDDTSVTLGAPVRLGAAVRRRGDDFQPDQPVLEIGAHLTPAAVGLAATVGCAKLRVGRRLRVAVHSSGNELLPVEASLTPGKIRNSNLYSIAARLTAWGAVPLLRPVLLDTPEAVRDGLLETLALEPDAIVTTGGVSAGDLDFIREVARELGTDVQVRKVNMKPGKPLVDGLLGSTPFFGLPGNPAACLVSFEIFVRPALAKLEGRHDGLLPERTARAVSPIPVVGGGREQFVRARTTFDRERAEYQLAPTGGQGSHLLTSFAQANCLVRIAPDQGSIEEGQRVTILLLD